MVNNMTVEEVNKPEIWCHILIVVTMCSKLRSETSIAILLLSCYMSVNSFVLIHIYLDINPEMLVLWLDLFLIFGQKLISREWEEREGVAF